jgi:CheY-like chemotaxis protein
MLRRLIPEDISIKDRLSRDLPYIKADHSQIEQILINLVVNARDAIKEKNNPHSEKHITIKTSLVKLDQSFVEAHPGSQLGPHILMSVGDTGIGMDKSILDRIFEPFFTTKEINKGTGLGLATVYGIVKQNDGFIEIDSEQGIGTNCNIYWPTTSEKPSPELAQILKHKALSGSETILLVEDDDGVRDFTASTLDNFGYDIIQAENGQKAIGILQTSQPAVDLLITDIIMPEMNGQELAKRLKKIIPLKRVLFVSGYTFDYLKQDGALEEGINFLQKPYSIHDILSKIREILDSQI